MQDHSEFPTRLLKPSENEPRDLERFFDDFEARFKSSTTKNLTTMRNFKPALNETPERMFAQYNMLCKPLEDEEPRVMTKDQLKTTFQCNLHLILTQSESQILNFIRYKNLEQRCSRFLTRPRWGSNASCTEKLFSAELLSLLSAPRLWMVYRAFWNVQTSFPVFRLRLV